MYTILVVDDVKINVNILVDLLAQEYDILVSLDGQTALDILEEEKVDLILLDIMMPLMNGYDVCKILKQNQKTKDIPVVFITAMSDEESIEKAYLVGGSDYITKPFKPRELLARVKKELQVQSLIQELESSQERLKLLASIDSLTNLYNRRYFSQISEHILDLAKREREEVSLIMIDIDNFKSINDTYGHQIGDEVIIALSKRLMESQRKSDVVCRYGGEEFVVLLPNTNIDGAKVVAEKIREEIENITVAIGEESCLHFTVSLGVSMVKMKEEHNLEAVLKRADDAMYEAKKSGKNRVVSKK
jgi:diguanylate cyclase (GGDEF)-like protein